MKVIEIILSLFGLIYWIYLLDPLTKNFTKRNYLKFTHFNNSSKINIVLSLIFFLTQTFLYTKIFPLSMPLFFIILVYILNSIHKKYLGRNFKLVLRGDLFSTTFYDHLITSLILLGSLFFPIILMFFFIKK